MSARHFLENHWPSITIAVTATAIAGAFLVMLRSMPPHQIVMATGREGDVYYEIGERYRAALSYENVQVQLMPTAGSVENLAMLRDPNSGVIVALIEGGILSAADSCCTTGDSQEVIMNAISICPAKSFSPASRGSSANNSPTCASIPVRLSSSSVSARVPLPSGPIDILWPRRRLAASPRISRLWNHHSGS